MTDMPLEQSAPRVASPTRPFYWAVRREVWENKSIWAVPLAVAVVVLFTGFIGAVMLPGRMAHILTLDPEKQRQAIETPFDFAASMIILTAFLVGVFYCADALYGERRDRSILFWKSLPVSDRTTVLSKASVPLVVLPLLVYPLVLITHLAMLLMRSVFLLGNSAGLAVLWKYEQFLPSCVAVLYAIVVMALWLTPVFAYLLLVSAWARRAPLMWAILPPLVVAAFERGAFGTKHLFLFLAARLAGWFQRAVINDHNPNPLDSLTPGRFLATPALWIGLAFAAVFLAAAVRLRRNREPI